VTVHTVCQAAATLVMVHTYSEVHIMKPSATLQALRGVSGTIPALSGTVCPSACQPGLTCRALRCELASHTAILLERLPHLLYHLACMSGTVSIRRVLAA
jgi:hypothetical protein